MNILFKLYVPYEQNKNMFAVKELVEKEMSVSIDFEIMPNGSVVKSEDPSWFWDESNQYHSIRPQTTDPDKFDKILYSRFLLEEGFQYANTKLWYVLFEFSTAYLSKDLFTLFNDLAVMTKAYWAKANPSDTEAIINMQHLHDLPDSIKTYDLPKLKSPNELLAPTTPVNLGWMNYWNKECLIEEHNGYKSMLDSVPKYFENEDGSISFMITADPLDLDDPTHMSVLMEHYEREFLG